MIKPNLPSPKTITFSYGFIWCCSVISSAAASGSTNTACLSGTLSGTSKSANYLVSVNGDIAAEEVIKVEPEESVELVATNKGKQTGIIIITESL